MSVLPRLGVAACLLLIATPLLAQPRPGVPGPPAQPKVEPPPAPTQPKVSAIPNAPKSPSAEDVAKARALFNAAGKSYDKGDYVAAIQAFERAYSLSGRSSILFSLGMAYKKRFAESQDEGHRAAAVELLRAYIDATKDGGRKPDAIRALEDLGQRSSGSGSTSSGRAEARKTIISIDSTTPGAMISVDGGEPAPPQVDAEVNAGRHTIKVTAPGYVTQEFVMQALAGQTEAETFNLQQAPATLDLVLPSSATIHVDGRDQGSSSKLSLSPGRHFISISKPGHKSFGQIIELRGDEKRKLEVDLSTTIQRDASIGMMAGGGATMVGGGVLLGMAFVAQSQALELEEARESTGISESQRVELEDLTAERDLLRASGLLVGAVGGAAFLAGGAMFFFDNPGPLPLPIDEAGSPKSNTPQPGLEMSWTPVVTPFDAGLYVRGRF